MAATLVMKQQPWCNSSNSSKEGGAPAKTGKCWGRLGSIGEDWETPAKSGELLGLRTSKENIVKAL